MTSIFKQCIEQARLPADSAAWLKPLREAGLNHFNALDLPSQKDEAWKYTNLRPLASKPIRLSQEQPDFKTALLDKTSNSHRLVFVGGFFNQQLSDMGNLPAGISVLSLQSALASQDESLKVSLASAMPTDSNAFAALNTALFSDGALISIAPNTMLKKPIELVFIDSGDLSLSLPRNVIVLAQGASASVIERQLSDDDASCLSNSATEIILAEDAVLDFDLVQLHGQKTTHIGAMWAYLAARSRLNSRVVTLGGQLVRNELRVKLSGADASAECSGLFYGRRRQHIDNHTTIEHAASSCTSHQLYKGVLDERSRGVFHGRIKVNQIAQLTVADQQNPNLLLSRDAEVDTQPQLEIYADDVKCAHGATVGELDQEQQFYLQSRGIDPKTAKTMLTYAFAAEVINEVKNPALRSELAARIEQRMNMSELSQS